MPFAPTSPVTGATVTGLTSPTFTIVDDLAPAINAKSKVVSALGGTQGGASANSAAYPFTASLFKPVALKAIPAANPITGLRGTLPMNQWKLNIRKGGDAASGVPGMIVARLTIDVTAGMETYDPDEIRSFCSFLGGYLNSNANGLSDSIVTGVL